LPILSQAIGQTEQTRTHKQKFGSMYHLDSNSLIVATLLLLMMMMMMMMMMIDR
jgi:hypothetical protein